MATAILNAPQFQNEAAAFAYVEARLWPEGPVCPHCGNADQKRLGRLQGKTTRQGLHKCYECKKPFTVRMGSIFESSHLPLHLWLQVIHLMCASKKGISARQIQRMLSCSMKTAWFLCHRIRHAMAPAELPPMGGDGETIEADETAITNSRKTKRGPGRKKPKAVVLSLVQRGGNIRSMLVDHKTVGRFIHEHVHPESRLVTDGAQHYVHSRVAKHESVDHSKFEWTRGDVHTNNLEGFFSIFKRGLVGTYQHMDAKHFDKYLAEFDFRQNHRARLGIDDVQRSALAVESAKGKRLYYRQPV
jgi:transposase-like protein